MNETNIIVQIHALQPTWIEHEKPKYRIYIDDDLITERTWIWDNQTYVEEDMLVCVSKNTTHNIRLDLIKSDPMHLSQFGLQSLKINGWPKPDHGGHRSELSFTLE